MSRFSRAAGAGRGELQGRAEEWKDDEQNGEDERRQEHRGGTIARTEEAHIDCPILQRPRRGGGKVEAAQIGK